MLKDYIGQCGVMCNVVRNDEIDFDEVDRAKYDAFVLSPGPGTPDGSGMLMQTIARYHKQIPMLGVCLGHQALGLYFGATLNKAAVPMHGKTSMIKHNGHALFKHIPEQFVVTRYHSLLLYDMQKQTEVIATSASGEVMALAHSTLPLYGIQFHPESCQTEHGLTLIKNFLELVKARTS